jgi:uncharacterized protein YqgC (DUF456 family)
MNTVLIIGAIILILIGIVGSVVPGLAGPPFSWAGLLLLGLSTAADYSLTFLIITAVVAVIITIMDYVVPSLSTKKHGGSKAGVWGCNIGLIISIIGLPFGPQGIIGVIFWPFVGALVGELLGGKKSREALRAAWGAFVGFLCGTGLKLAYALVCAFFVVKDLIS